MHGEEGQEGQGRKGLLMAHQVVWTRSVLDAFIKEANLTDLEAQIMETRVAGMTRTQQCFYFSMSMSALDRKISILKKKYDWAQKNSSVLPVRKSSSLELWMDKN